MSERDIRNRLSILFQILQLMNEYEAAFIERIGEKGYHEKIDSVLDEINFLRSELEKIEKSKK